MDEVLAHYSDVLKVELLDTLHPIRIVDHNIELLPRMLPLSRAPYRLNQTELVELKQ